jgi:hypothetical protein
MIKMSHFKFNQLKDKEFWKKELKNIKWSDLLIWLAIFLIFMGTYTYTQAGKDPCAYCMINREYEEDISCKDFFNSKLNEDRINSMVNDFGLDNLNNGVDNGDFIFNNS